MNHWPFIIAAYAVLVIAVGGLSIVSFVTMRRAEAAVDALRDKK